MAKPPVLKPREVAAILASLGFVEVRQRGSHRQYRHADGRGTTVPFHQGRDVSPVFLPDKTQNLNADYADWADCADIL
jgi:predicted RNA binding protein YcfA (HicA-like mRNA interferase family)